MKESIEMHRETFILLIVQEIPTLGLQDCEPFFNTAFFYVDKGVPSRCHIDLRDLNRFVMAQRQPLVYPPERAEQARQNMINAVGVDVVEELLGGNSEVLALIDSPGGYGGYSKQIVDSVEYVTRNSEDSKAYIFRMAYSAAFIICKAFNERYCFEESEFMFHKGSIPTELKDKSTAVDPDTQAMLDDTELSEMQEHLDDFFRIGNKEKRQEIERLITVCLENHHCDTYYSGSNLLEVGAVTKCLDSPAALSEKFKEDLGLTLSTGSCLDNVLVQLVELANQEVPNSRFLIKSSPLVVCPNEEQGE